ncbi:MAG: SusC/RagA family TonB-linked outer membrane protein [Chitinophagaceae bacterium]
MRKIAFLSKMLMLCCAILYTVLAYAQTRTITGKVADDKGDPVPFASIKVKGTSAGASADANGNFLLKVSGNPTLVISSQGFQTAETEVGSSNVINLTLKAVTGQLQEVIVTTALGQNTRKAKVGYATTTFGSNEITKSAPANLLDGLSGKIAGANISKTGGPGSSTKVVLRGYGIIGGGNNQPLYVIDGIPYNDSRIGSTVSTAASAHLDFGNALNDINPNDIESLTVLKGTAASSLYGSAAKNGAIMITTKKGKSGKLKIEYSGSANFSKVGKMPDYQESYGGGWNATSYNVENGSWGPRLDGVVREWGSDLGTGNAQKKPFSFVKDNIRNAYETGREFNNTLSLSGGGEGTQFYFSYGNVNSDGVVPFASDYYSRNTFSARTNSKFNKFTINTSFNYVNKRQNAPYSGQGLNLAGNSGAFFDEILQIPADINISKFRDFNNPYYNVDNYFTVYAENPYYVLNQNRNKQNSDRFFGNMDMGYKFTNSFSAQFRLGADFTNARTFGYANVISQTPGSYGDGGANNSEQQARTADVGYVQELNNYIGSVNSDFILKYNHDIGKDFSVDALAGYNFFQEDQKATDAYITNLVVPGFYNLSNTTVAPKTTDAVAHRRRMGVYAQAVVGFRNQVYLTVNARNDWSSTLPSDNNHFFYPGASLAWTASETFDLGKSVSLLKFRASYGKTGADPNAYLTNNTLVVGDVTLPFGSLAFPFNGVSSYVFSTTINNPKLKPIITKEAEIGMELRFWNRIGIDLSLYRKRTEGQIFAVPIAPSTGSLSLVSNLGVVRNQGIEIAFDAKPVSTKDFTWNLIYTFTKNDNKVLALSSGLNKVTLNTATEVELNAYPNQSVTDIYATVARRDPNGNIIVSATGVPVAATDKANLGSTQYDFTMGLVNSFNYKGLTLGFSFDYRKGGIMYSRTADLIYFTGNAWMTTYNDRRPFIIPGSVTESFDAQGKPVYTPNVIPYREVNYDTYWYPSSNRSAVGMRIFDRSFLKLRDITLSYALPQRWASKIAASSLSVGVYATNFLLWTPKENLFVDPESSNLGNDIASEMGEFGTTPQSKNFGITLKATF